MANDTVKTVLFEYVKNEESSFYWYHNPIRINYLNKLYESEIEYIRAPCRKLENGNVIHEHLYGFFESTLDEVRLKKANQFSTFALKISDYGILSYFRVAASMREFGADIDFNRQRDHAAHTLYNYILGWYIFDNSVDDNFKQCFTRCLENKQRCIDGTHNPLTKGERESYISRGKDTSEYGTIGGCEESIVLANEFGDVWSITSLLHDIGYILEGTLSQASIEMENVRISRGSKLIHDYFNHRFWKDTTIDYRAMQSIAKVLNVAVPDFRYTRSLASLGDHLCNAGFCENIRDNLDKCDGYTSISETINKPCGFNREAFSLWGAYYEVYHPKTINGNKKSTMECILGIVKKQYYDAMWKGSNQGYRNLNHGVCGGAIVLKALSFFYDFVYGFKKDGFNTWDKYPLIYSNLVKAGILNEENKVSEQSYNDINNYITTRFLPGPVRIRGERKADFWFNKVLWATASVAVHDIIQEEYYEKICKKRYPDRNLKIILSEDPLAYLGVLVDALQEWDRYTVLGRTAFSNEELLQSNEAYIERNKTEFYYPKRNEDFLDEKITKVLERCLDKWKDVIKVDKLINLDVEYAKLIKSDGKLGVVGQVGDLCGPIILTARARAKGGSGKYTWNVENLPEDLKLNTINDTTVKVSGIPNLPGVFNIDVTVEDSCQSSWIGKSSFTLIINPKN